MTNEQRVERWLTRWKHRLLLDNWAITVEFMEKNRAPAADGSLTLAEIVVNLRYTQADLLLYPRFFKEPVQSQQAAFVHELCHIHTNGIDELLQTAVGKGAIKEKARLDTWERLTEDIAKVAVRAYTRSNKPSTKYHL